MSTAKWNEKFELPEGSYYVSDIQYYFQYIIQKHETVTDNPPIRIYVNKTENRIKFSSKTCYYLDSLTPENMKLLKNCQNMPHSEVIEVVLFHGNIK